MKNAQFDFYFRLYLFSENDNFFPYIKILKATVSEIIIKKKETENEAF